MIIPTIYGQKYGTVPLWEFDHSTPPRLLTRKVLVPSSSAAQKHEGLVHASETNSEVSFRPTKNLWDLPGINVTLVSSNEDLELRV